MYDLSIPLGIMIGMVGLGFGLACYVTRAMSYYHLERRIAYLERLQQPIKQTTYRSKTTEPRIRYRSVESPQPVTD